MVLRSSSGVDEAVATRGKLHHALSETRRGKGGLVREEGEGATRGRDSSEGSNKSGGMEVRDPRLWKVLNPNTTQLTFGLSE